MKMPKRGWQLAAGQSVAHWFKRHGFWYRSICGTVAVIALQEQGHLQLGNKCKACAAALKDREDAGLPC